MKSIKHLLGDRDIELLIGQVLRAGVVTASLIAFIGGVLYLVQHGGNAVPDYRHFTGEGEAFTTFSGILRGLFSLQATAVIQFGVLVLLATPIVRIVFSLVAFALEKDRMYVIITLIVLAIILFSMFAGIGG